MSNYLSIEMNAWDKLKESHISEGAATGRSTVDNTMDQAFEVQDMLTREDIWLKLINPVFLHQFLGVVDEEEFKFEDAKHESA